MAATARDDGPGKDGPARRRLSRGVVWTGIALGTCLAVLATTDGAVVPVGGVPSWLGLFLGGVIVWALIAAASVTLTELTRRHHRTARRYAVRQGKRGAIATGRAAGNGARSLWARRAAARAGQDRQPGKPVSAPAAAATAAPAGAATTKSPPGDRGKGTVPMTATQPGRPVSRITPARRAQFAAARTGGTMPEAWKAVIARTVDFEPENDGDLLDWMADEVTGAAAYAEALVDLYEGLTQGTGLDQVAMAALHDVADAQAHASETMSGARRKFSDHYDRPREFAAEGGLMPHDGRWVTGEGDA